VPATGTVRVGDVLRVRAYLMPPAPPALPGAYDYARRAWLDGLGATGKVLPPLAVMSRDAAASPDFRTRLSDHIAQRVAGAPGAFAITLATGDQWRITPADEEAMRRSGLAHLLSISGIHVTALIGATVFVVFRILALSRRLALRWPLMLVSAGAGAGVGIFYTLLTGAEVPTIRSCITALLVMAGLALGREALRLRLLAVAALVVMVLWPDAVVGPSFQLSFMVVCVIISLHEHPRVRAWQAPREEDAARRLGRWALGLLVTGLAVEMALVPIALYHSHKTGLLGVVANMVAIPLSELVILPAEALALLLDLFGAGAPLWWIVERALALLLAITRLAAAETRAMLLTPAIPAWAFATVMTGLLWALLWRTRVRWAGLAVAGVGLVGYVLAPVPDILVTADGHHVAVRLPDGRIALLRARG
jgi:competence protein ComEC